MFPYIKYMNREEVKEYLIDFQKKQLPRLVERELKIKDKKIESIIGPRRAGKTYFFYQKIEEMIKSGIRRENILYLNFEDPRLYDLNFKEIREIIKLHWELYPPSAKEQLHIFFDEPQNIGNWEIAVRSLHDEGFSIYITGSSSKLLSREIATSLRGRTISYVLLPFSFKEFLRMKGGSPQTSGLSSKERSFLLGLLNEYLELGGFPEIISESDMETKIRVINEYFNLTVYKDIAERYKIKNTFLIKWLIKSVMGSFSREFSIHKAYLTLKSKGLRVSKNTLYSYVSMLQDAMFAFFLQKSNPSPRKKEFSINKVYLCDICFTKLVETTTDKGRRMENAVFLELERRRKPLTEIFYWRDYLQHEVDFVIRDGSKVRQLIQVTYASEKNEIEKREVSSLIRASREFNCRNLLVITWDYEGEEEVESNGLKRRIKFIPLWKWLLQPV